METDKFQPYLDWYNGNCLDGDVVNWESDLWSGWDSTPLVDPEDRIYSCEEGDCRIDLYPEDDSYGRTDVFDFNRDSDCCNAWGEWLNGNQSADDLSSFCSACDDVADEVNDPSYFKEFY